MKQYFMKMLQHHTTTRILLLPSAMTAELPFSIFFTYTHILRFLFRYTGVSICLSKWLLLTFWCSASNPQQLVKCIREGQFSCQKTVSKVRNARSLSSSKEIRSGGVLRSDKEPNIKGLVHFCIFLCWKSIFSSLYPTSYPSETPFESYKIYWMQKHQHSIMHLKFSRPSHLFHICHWLQHSTHHPINLKLE